MPSMRLSPIALIAVNIAVFLAASLTGGAAEIPFLTQHTVEATQRSDWLDSGDVDGDGDLDLVTANCTFDFFALWRNGGDDISWTQVLIDFTSADCPRMIRLADVDADGDLDAVGAASNSNGAVLWFENTAGDGSTWTTHTLTVNTGPAYWVDTADMDADGDLDVTAALGTRIVWWSNDGGSWTQHEVAPWFVGPRSASPADIDGDGDLDLIGTSITGDEIAWWSNDGACTPSCSWSKTVIGTLDEANAVAPADLDGDGDLDVIVAGHASGTVGWWENALDGAAWIGHTLSTSVPLSWAVAAADLDSDGDLDVVGTAIASSSLIWWENDGSSCNPDCTWPERSIDNLFGFADAVVIDDLDQDGDLDVVGGSQADGIAWWENERLHRSALFDGAEVISEDFNSTTWLGAADLDGDADLDLVIGTYSSSLLALENRWGAAPSFGPVTSLAAIGGVYAVAFGDIDKDGREDIVAGSYDTDTVYWFANPGYIAGTWTSTTIATAFDGPLGLGVADLDGDGDLDVVGAALGDGVSWFENDALSWTEHVIDATMTGAQVAEIGDLDGDGDLDIFSAANLADTMRWWANDGGSPPNWTAHDVALGVHNRKADLVDLDGDGDLDVVAAGNDLAWWENTNGAGTAWLEHVVQESVSNLDVLHAVDADADGDQDIVAANLWNATWWENAGGDGLTWTEHTLPASVTGDAWLATVADVDRDGLVDVVGGTVGHSNLSWWPNRGGQFALPTTDAVAADHPTEGTEVTVLAIDLVHRGRTGDDAAELATLELLFEASPGTPLAGAELGALADALTLYLDDGDGIWNGADTVVHSLTPPYSLTDGVLSVVLPDDAADLQVASGASRTYFLTLDLAADSATAVPDTVVVTHLTESSSTGEMASTDLPLTLEHLANTAATGLEVNGTPRLLAPIGTQVATVGHQLSLDVSGAFSDPDPDALSFAAADLPASLSMTSSGVIEGTPETGDVAGSPYSVTVTAADAWGETVAGTFSLSVILDEIFSDGFETGDTSGWSP